MKNWTHRQFHHWCKVGVDKKKQLEQTPWFICFSLDLLCTSFKDFFSLKKWQSFLVIEEKHLEINVRLLSLQLAFAQQTPQPILLREHLMSGMQKQLSVFLHQSAPSHLFSWSHGLEASSYFAWSGANWQQTHWLCVRWPETMQEGRARGSTRSPWTPWNNSALARTGHGG